jgi:hypothetical protein
VKEIKIGVLTYLLLAVHDLSDEVHGTIAYRWEVQLTFNRQYVVDVDLALHRSSQLASAHCNRLRSV